jgi:hypothetical protein
MKIRKIPTTIIIDPTASLVVNFSCRKTIPDSVEKGASSKILELLGILKCL